MTSFTQIFNQKLELGKLMAAVDSRKKGPKNVRSILRYRLKFGKISRKTNCVRKCKKLDIENLIIGAL